MIEPLPEGPAAPWRFVEHSGSVRELHELAFPHQSGREVWIMRPTGAALVLGSGGRAGGVDHAAAAARALPVVRRRSGGAAVLVRPADLLWVDVLVAPDDPLWHPDVGRAFGWLGRAWQQALAACGVASELHDGPYAPGKWGSLVCFAGLGTGELTRDGAKVLGLSQRRTSRGARFQSALLRRWAPAELTALLALDPPQRAELDLYLARCAAAVPVAPERLLAAFRRALPT